MAKKRPSGGAGSSGSAPAPSPGPKTPSSGTTPASSAPGSLPRALLVLAALAAIAGVIASAMRGADTTPSAGGGKPHARSTVVSPDDAAAAAVPESPIKTKPGTKAEPKAKAEPEAKTKAPAVKRRTLVPATEMVRGLPGSLQRELYEDGETPFASFVVVNDNGTESMDVMWNGELIALAPAGFRTPIESWVGHEFVVDGERVVVDGTWDALVRVPGETALVKTRASELPPGREPKPLARVALDTQAKAIKVRNLSGKRMHQFWVPDDGSERVYQGVIDPNSESTTNSYLTHRFQFTELKNKNKVLFDFRVNERDDVYAYVEEGSADPDLLRRHREELEMAADYKRRTGRSWYSYYPHLPVRTFTWPANEIGQVFKVRTSHLPGGGEGEMTLEVLSVRPRVFLIRNAITDAEAAEIIRRAKKGMAPSSVQAHDENGELVASNTRTSLNSWVERDRANADIDRVFRRAADLLRINETVFHSQRPDGKVEAMQVVHYKSGSHYAPHHDWGVHGPYTRLATLLFYLNDPTKGQGMTAFPKAVVGKRDGLRLHPGKGHAVLFYSQTPDGNVDDLSLHEAMPCCTKGGEKWLANLWVHDVPLHVSRG